MLPHTLRIQCKLELFVYLSRKGSSVKDYKITYVVAYFPVISVRTGAIEFMYSLVDQIRPASATVLTRVALATDEFYRTIFTTVLRVTVTRVISPSVGTHTVFARHIPFALVDIVLTMVAFVALIAFTGVTADAIDPRRFQLGMDCYRIR